MIDAEDYEEVPPGPDECRAAAGIVVSMTRGLLESDRETLRRVGIEQLGPFDALDGRSTFFENCLNDPEILAVGFSDERDFPIPRNGFAERAIRYLRPEDADELPPPWNVATENIYVPSPNWDREDQFTRNWKGKDSLRRDCFFTIEDDEFWLHARRKQLHVDVLDQLRVQWAFQIVNGRPKQRRVLRVLEFNGEKLAEPLTDEEVTSRLGRFEQFEQNPGQTGLFSENQ